FVEGSNKPISEITWQEFKTALVKNYGLTVEDNKAHAHEELLSMRFKEQKETIEQFIDRYNALHIRSGVSDAHVLIRYFLRALPADLVSNINITLESASTEAKNNLKFICSKARNLYNQARSLDTTATGFKRSSSSAASPSDSLKKSKHAPSSSASIGKQKVKTGKFCSFHRVTTHNTKECEARKKGEEPKVKNKCRRCGAPGWSPSHRCNTAVCSGSSSSPSGDVVVRSLSTSSVSSGVQTSTGGQVSATTQKMELDSDEESLLIAANAQKCKFDAQFSEMPKQKSNSLILPVIIENVKTYALLDTGSTCSLVTPEFFESFGSSVSFTKSN
ncbi:hypothetical protein EC973_008684, partial [Apophysomyces ossiformis]